MGSNLELSGSLIGCRRRRAFIILSVHDELLILCRPEDAEAVAEMANSEISEVYRIALGGELLVPIIFGAKPIKSWAEK